MKPRLLKFHILILLTVWSQIIKLSMHRCTNLKIIRLTLGISPIVSHWFVVMFSSRHGPPISRSSCWKWASSDRHCTTNLERKRTSKIKTNCVCNITTNNLPLPVVKLLFTEAQPSVKESFPRIILWQQMSKPLPSITGKQMWIWLLEHSAFPMSFKVCMTFYVYMLHKYTVQMHTQRV